MSHYCSASINTTKIPVPVGGGGSEVVVSGSVVTSVVVTSAVVTSVVVDTSTLGCAVSDSRCGYITFVDIDTVFTSWFSSSCSTNEPGPQSGIKLLASSHSLTVIHDCPSVLYPALQAMTVRSLMSEQVVMG